MTTSTRQDRQERTARCGYGWTCEAEATDAGNCAEHAELVAVRRAIFRSGQSVPSNATIEELRAMLPIIAGGGPELDADYGHPLHGGAYGAAGCEDCAGQAVVAGAARKAESVAEAARKASADHYDGCGECTWAGTMCAAAVVISDAALGAYIAEARAKDEAYNGPSRFEALLRSTSAAALERVGLTRSGSPIIGGGGPELDDDNRKVAKCRGCLHVGVGWYWNANTGDMRTRCHDAPIDWQPVKRGPAIAGGGPELDAEAERPDCGRPEAQPCTCEPDDPNTIGFLTAEDGVICAGCAAEYGGGQGGEWPPVLANVIYEYDVDPCPDCGKAVDDWPTLGMLAAGQAALGPHRWKRGALDIIACEDCGDMAGPLGMGSTRRDCRGRLGAA